MAQSIRRLFHKVFTVTKSGFYVHYLGIFPQRKMILWAVSRIEHFQEIKRLSQHNTEEGIVLSISDQNICVHVDIQRRLCMVKRLRRERRQGDSRGNRNTMDIVSPSQTRPGHCGTNTIGNLHMDFGKQKMRHMIPLSPSTHSSPWSLLICRRPRFVHCPIDSPPGR